MPFHGAAEGFDGVCAARADGDEKHLVGFQVDDVVEFAFEADQIAGGEAADENRVLAAEAEVFADAGDFAQALGVGDIVGDEVGVHFGA